MITPLAYAYYAKLNALCPIDVSLPFDTPYTLTMGWPVKDAAVAGRACTDQVPDSYATVVVKGFAGCFPSEMAGA
jgi:hypothetical protein